MLRVKVLILVLLVLFFVFKYIYGCISVQDITVQKLPIKVLHWCDSGLWFSRVVLDIKRTVSFHLNGTTVLGALSYIIDKEKNKASTSLVTTDFVSYVLVDFPTLSCRRI